MGLDETAKSALAFLYLKLFVIVMVPIPAIPVIFAVRVQRTNGRKFINPGVVEWVTIGLVIIVKSVR